MSPAVILRALVLVGVGASPAASQTPVVSDELRTAAIELHLVWNDVYGQLAHEYEAVRKHLQAIFDGTDVRISWETNGICNRPELPATHFRLIVRPGESSAIGFPAGTMGASLGTATPREAALIFVPDILRALDLKSSFDRARPLKESMLLARAVARVVVHEIVHALIPERKHDPKGLMGVRLTRKQLTQPGLKPSAEVMELLAHRLLVLVANGRRALGEGDKK